MAASDQAQTADDAQSQETHQKDVTLTAYSDGDFDTSREFIDSVLGDLVDFSLMEKKVTEHRSTRLDIEIEEELDGEVFMFEDSVNASFSFEKDALLNAVDGAELPEWIEFIDSVEKTSSYKYSPQKAVKSIVKEMFDGDELEEYGYDEHEGLYLQAWTRKVEDHSVDADPDDTIAYDARVNVPNTIEEKQILTHQSERTQENRYESDDEHWSFQIKVHLEADTDDRLDSISEELVPAAYSELASIDGVDKVRISGCKKKVEQTGECYNF